MSPSGECTCGVPPSGGAAATRKHAAAPPVGSLARLTVAAEQFELGGVGRPRSTVLTTPMPKRSRSTTDDQVRADSAFATFAATERGGGPPRQRARARARLWRNCVHWPLATASCMTPDGHLSRSTTVIFRALRSERPAVHDVDGSPPAALGEWER